MDCQPYGQPGTAASAQRPYRLGSRMPATATYGASAYLVAQRPDLVAQRPRFQRERPVHGQCRASVAAPASSEDNANTHCSEFFISNFGSRLPAITYFLTNNFDSCIVCGQPHVKCHLFVAATRRGGDTLTFKSSDGIKTTLKNNV